MQKLALLIQLAPTIISGGLAGAVFNLIVSRPDPTILLYSIGPVTSYASASLMEIVPGVKIEIGKERVAAMVTHTIDFVAKSGPSIESADIAITFSAKRDPVKVYGIKPVGESSVNRIGCNSIDEDILCKLTGISTDVSYRVTVVTNETEVRSVRTAKNGLRLMKREEYNAKSFMGLSNQSLAILLLLGVSAGSIIYMVRVQHAVRRMERLYQVGKRKDLLSPLEVARELVVTASSLTKINNKDKAYDYYQEALSLFRAIKDAPMDEIRSIEMALETLKAQRQDLASGRP